MCIYIYIYLYLYTVRYMYYFSFQFLYSKFFEEYLLQQFHHLPHLKIWLGK